MYFGYTKRERERTLFLRMRAYRVFITNKERMALREREREGGGGDRQAGRDRQTGRDRETEREEQTDKHRSRPRERERGGVGGVLPMTADALPILWKRLRPGFVMRVIFFTDENLSDVFFLPPISQCGSKFLLP